MATVVDTGIEADTATDIVVDTPAVIAVEPKSPAAVSVVVVVPTMAGVAAASTEAAAVMVAEVIAN
jgi:hypothetical protein